jgi:hypothetical protein
MVKVVLDSVIMGRRTCRRPVVEPTRCAVRDQMGECRSVVAAPTPPEAASSTRVAEHRLQTTWEAPVNQAA